GTASQSAAQFSSNGKWTHFSEEGEESGSAIRTTCTSCNKTANKQTKEGRNAVNSAAEVLATKSSGKMQSTTPSTGPYSMSSSTKTKARASSCCYEESNDDDEDDDEDDEIVFVSPKRRASTTALPTRPNPSHSKMDLFDTRRSRQVR